MKYIIELNPDCVDGEFLRMPIRLAGEDQWIKTKALLTPYTESDRKAIEDEVWEFARKMISTSENEVSEMWGCATNFGEVMHNTTYSEAKFKYETWKKHEIKIGDEVIAKDNMKYFVGDYYEPFIITGMFFNNVIGFGKKYKNHSMGINDVVKTGRHFTRKEIDVLKEYLEVDEDNQCEQKISYCCEEV